MLSHVTFIIIFSFYLCLYTHIGSQVTRYVMYKVFFLCHYKLALKFSDENLPKKTSALQICLEEITNNGISVKWESTVAANNVKSNPLCYYEDKLVTRNCVDSKWDPPINELKPCLQIVNNNDFHACPPGFDKVSNNHDYCYEIKKLAAWDYPCLKSGGASVITDLSDEDVISLISSLQGKNVSQFFWLPAKRIKFFSPIVWHIPGSKWGHAVETSNILNIQTSFFKNCLLLDVQRQNLITETCTEEYPALCFYKNDINFLAKCPPKYHSVRYMSDEGICLGIEEPGRNLTFNDFIDNKICNVSMGYKNIDLMRFIYKEIAAINNLPNDVWCWFASIHVDQEFANIFNFSLTEKYVSVNNIGTLRLRNSNTFLPCMACQTEVIYEKTELLFEYNEKEKVMYLTIYFPSGLWKYNKYDRGIQCFSDGKGFVKAIDINDLPFHEVKSEHYNKTIDSINIDKSVYKINVIRDRAAQYWCEGHTTNLSLITTNIIVVNPLGNKVHVFSLVIKIFFDPNDIKNILKGSITQLCYNITNIFAAKKVLLMQYLEYTSNFLTVLLHMDIPVENIYEDNARNIQRVYNTLLNISETQLHKHNYIFVNLSSSMYCLPTTSIDNNSIMLNWELTAIGHVAAPKQFCLQENGLPVRRLCDGSYLLGSFWGTVEGSCNQNYQPSDTTTFLYNFVKGQVPENDISRFLTDGLSFVLGDIDIIIPADIYYLSKSLQHILCIAQENQTSIDMGNVENIAWVMDRVMILNNNYLRLAQTLNSTNVILDSLNNIIEMLAYNNEDEIQESRTDNKNGYRLATEPQFILQISYPWTNNISGVAIIKTRDNDQFTNMEIRPLFLNSTLEKVLTIDNLEIATWLPGSVLNSLIKENNEKLNETSINKENMHIIITVFHNDAIFQEISQNQYKVNSRIVGVSMPGFLSNLVKPMPFIYKNLSPTSLDKNCGFWNFQPHSVGNVPGYWSDTGCYLKNIEKGLTICECYHLTHFGQLLNIGRNKNHTASFSQKHSISLNIISLIGSFLSLLGIMGIWITATVFHNWRKKASTKVLLHLSTSIALPLLFMTVFNLDSTIFEEVNGVFIVSESLRVLCISLGALLHYSVLASFMWMLITAVLQFIRYVRVLGVYRPSRFMIKFTLIGWGTPVIPVIVVLALDHENYIPTNILPTGRDSDSMICYPNGSYLIVCVIVPICIILTINISLFILVIYAISKGPDGKMRRADIDLIGAQLRLSIFLFFLLGLTWIFGVLSFSNNLLWSYLFCLTSTMQGFVLFVYFIICDAQTRNLWVTLMKPQFQLESSRKSVTSISSN